MSGRTAGRPYQVREKYCDMLWMYVRMLVIILKVLNLVYSKLIKDVLTILSSSIHRGQISKY